MYISYIKYIIAHDLMDKYRINSANGLENI